MPNSVPLQLLCSFFVVAAGCGGGAAYERRCRFHRRLHRAGRGMQAATDWDASVRFPSVQGSVVRGSLRSLAGRMMGPTAATSTDGIGRVDPHAIEEIFHAIEHVTSDRVDRIGDRGDRVAPGSVDGADRVVQAALAGSDGFWLQPAMTIAKSSCASEARGLLTICWTSRAASCSRPRQTHSRESSFEWRSGSCS